MNTHGEPPPGRKKRTDNSESGQQQTHCADNAMHCHTDDSRASHAFTRIASGANDNEMTADTK